MTTEEKIAKLKVARALLAKGKCNGMYAKAGGVRTVVSDPDAEEFCALGALIRACDDVTISERTTELSKELLVTKEQPLSHFSDTHSQEIVLALFDHAISRLEGGG